MCHPAVAVIATVLSTAVSAYSSYSAGKSEEAAAEYNAKLANKEATEAKNLAAVEAAKRQKEADQLVARQRSVAAAQGGVVDAGSNLDLFSATAAKGAEDAFTIRDNGAKRAQALQNEAQLGMWKGKAAGKAGILGAVGAGLSGAANTASVFSTYRFNTKLLEQGKKP